MVIEFTSVENVEAKSKNDSLKQNLKLLKRSIIEAEARNVYYIKSFIQS